MLNNENLSLKKRVENLISDGKYSEAEEIINKSQLNLTSMKSVVCIMQNKLDEAEIILKDGLNNLDKNNFELTYNLAYLYEITGRHEKAINTYIKANKLCMDKEMKLNIEAIIKKIKLEHANEPLVSVCMPVYNDEKSIEKAVKSVLNQTYQNFEIIICDNNSEDNTYQLLKSIKDPRIKLFQNNENIGWMLNSNKVLKLAKGDYIVTLHGDDSYLKDYIINVVRIFNENKNVGIVHFVTEDMKRIYFDNCSYISSKDYYSKIASCSCMPAPTQTAFRRDAIINSNYYIGEYWTTEVRLSMEIAKQNYDSYIEGKYLFERYGGPEKDSSQIDKQVARFSHLLNFYKEFKDDNNIKQEAKNSLKNNIVQSFINLYQLRNINDESKRAFNKGKELLKIDSELYNLVFDCVFNVN